MTGGISLGRIWKVPIQLHYSWFIIAALITWSLAAGYFPVAYPNFSTPVHIIMGMVTSVLFAASVLLHELGHVYVALREKIPVRGVTLFLFGGVAQITEEPKSAGAEFRIAIAGPVVSLALAGFFGALYLLDQAVPVLAAPSEYLARINLALALFNLIPGFPLDGGRVLRSAVWKMTGSLYKATRSASILGQVVAYGFMAVGVFNIIVGTLGNGLWLIFIGWFLQNAAATTLAQTTVQHQLRGVTVGQVMRPDFVSVDPLTPISMLVEERVLTGGQRTFIVCDQNRMAGLLTLADIARIPQRQWPFTPANKAMVPISGVASVPPEMELLNALQQMDTRQVAQVPVITPDGAVRGILSREDVIRYIRSRAEIGL